MQLPVVAYVKPTNYCNVGCEHCYLPESVRANAFRMTEDTLAGAAQLMQRMVTAQRAPGVLWIWHGGEPLTVPVTWYKAAGAILDAHIESRIESIQTSLIPYKGEFAPFIHDRCDSQLGSSIDFSQRKIKGSVEGYHDLWMKKVEMARADQIRVTPGIVPTKAELGRAGDIVTWMVDRGFAAFNVEKYNAYGAFNAAGCPSNKEHSDFLTELFHEVVIHRYQKGLTAPVVRVLQAAIGGVLHGEPGDRWGGSCMSSFVVVEPDGSLNNCPDKSTIDRPFSLLNEGPDAFLSSRERRNWIRLQVIGHGNRYCVTCDNSAWCKGGCPITPNDPDGQGDCSGYSRFIGNVRSFVSTPEGREVAERYRRESV